MMAVKDRLVSCSSCGSNNRIPSYRSTNIVAYFVGSLANRNLQFRDMHSAPCLLDPASSCAKIEASQRLQELLEKKQKGQPIASAKKAPPSNVYNLMDALRASIQGGQRTPAEKPAKATKKSKSAKPAAKRKAS
jgi:DNA end-binding protein Ku